MGEQPRLDDLDEPHSLLCRRGCTQHGLLRLVRHLHFPTSSLERIGETATR